jgi:NAD+ kinase
MFFLVYNVFWMKVGLSANAYKDSGLAVTREAAELFLAAGAELAAESAVAEGFPGVPVFDRDNIAPAPDLLVTVGGDGTILGIIAEAARKGIPVLGVNLGTVGFLAELERGELARAVPDLLRGAYVTDARAMLDISVNGGKGILALNECVVSRAPDAKMPEFDVYADGERLYSCRADGFIVGTPTGSTAYALSAGGPVLEPSVGAFVLLPLNAHSLRSRPAVIGDGAVIGLKIRGRVPAAVICADGKFAGTVSDKDEITIRRAVPRALFVRLKPQNFYARLQKKLSERGGG